MTTQLLLGCMLKQTPRMGLKLRERAAVPARSNREHHNEDSARATERPQAPAPPRVRDTVASGGGRREGQQLCLSLIYIYIYYAHTTFIECIQNYSIYIYIYVYTYIYMYTHIDVYKMCISACRYKCLDMHTYTYITKHAIPPPHPRIDLHHDSKICFQSAKSCQAAHGKKY